MIKKIISILVFIFLIASSVLSMGATFTSEQLESDIKECTSNGGCCSKINSEELSISCCGGGLSVSNSVCGNVGKMTQNLIISDEYNTLENIDPNLNIDDTSLTCSCGGPNCQTDQCQPCSKTKRCNCGRTACACSPQCVKYPNDPLTKCSAKVKNCNCGGPNCPCNKKGYCAITPDGYDGTPPCGGHTTTAVFNCKTQGCKGSNCGCGLIRAGVCGARVKCGWPTPHDCKTYGCKQPNCKCGNFCGKPPCQSSGKYYYVGMGTTNYLSIQDAIDESSTCDIIIVTSGTYYENIEINKGITLRGQGDTKPIIHGDGNRPTVLITADGVTFTGFNVQGGGAGEEDAGLEVRSNYCKIYDNTLNGNPATGINLRDSANFNIISENVIMNNLGAGIFVWEESDFNSIFFNNFRTNSWFNVKDYCNNYYDNSDNPTDYERNMCGNNWDDYEGSDNNADGIGDSPYLIQGGSNKDNYPLMSAWYNSPPETPTISGPSSGTAGVDYDYTMSTTDPDNHEITLHIDWDDGSIDEWVPTISGEEIYPYHSWSEEGTYTIRVKAEDLYGAESDWATLSISMPRSKSVSKPLLNFLKNYPFILRIFEHLRNIKQINNQKYTILESFEEISVKNIEKQKIDNIRGKMTPIIPELAPFIQNLGCTCGGYNCDCGGNPECGTNTRSCADVGCMGDSCNCDDYCAHDDNPDDAYPECGNRDNPDGRKLACTCGYNSCNCAKACKQYTGNYECNQNAASCGCTGNGCSCPTTDDCAWWDINHTGSPNGDCYNQVKQCNCIHPGCDVQGRCKSWYCKDYSHDCSCDIFFTAFLLTEDAINMGNTGREMIELYSPYEFIENIEIFYYLPDGIFYTGGALINGAPLEPINIGGVLKWVLQPMLPGFTYHVEFNIRAHSPKELELERMVKASGFSPLLSQPVFHDDFGVLNIIDNIPPTINNVNHNLVEPTLDISSDVTDDMLIYKVKAIIEDPSGQEDIWEMIKTIGDKYEVNLNCSHWKSGEYSYHIWADDITGNEEESPDYTFTIVEENLPPTTPIISGLSSGEPGTAYDYKFQSTDPNEDDVYYCIDWGDESEEITIGPSPSGEEITVTHIWNDKGEYIIRVKAQDVRGAESDWATFEVTMPKTYIHNTIIQLIMKLSAFSNF